MPHSTTGRIDTYNTPLFSRPSRALNRTECESRFQALDDTLEARVEQVRKEMAQQYLAFLREMIAPFNTRRHVITVSASMGLASVHVDGEPPTSLSKALPSSRSTPCRTWLTSSLTAFSPPPTSNAARSQACCRLTAGAPPQQKDVIMSLTEKLLAQGIQRPSIEHQLVGFYYTFGTFSMPEWEAADNTLIFECSRVQGALSARFENHLRALPEWTVREHDIMIEPYEMCTDDIETEEIDGRPAFSLWIYHGAAFPLDTLKAFRQALQAAIDEIRQESHGQVRIAPLKVVTDTTYTLLCREEVKLDA